VAHRLSTLQRPGAKGVPFFFARVDQAGTVTKRHSATRLQFARYGGACPLWNVHRAFETPGRFLRQLAETPDGARYVILARDVSKSGGAWGTPTRRYAISLGCEVRHARQLVYADGLDLDRDAFPAHRHLLPHLRTRALPPARRAAAGTPPARGPRPSRHPALRHRRP
jgi:predicted transcriptional regulator